MEKVDSRFLHLLQPIRDLTKNWEVDVAAQLGEYLEEVRGVLPHPPLCPKSHQDSALPPCPSQLDQICISFDNGKTTMNFMEAALLIQGSACIYSRKVEYLYMLVCQTLDCISNKKREKLPTSLRPDGRDADATFTDKEEQFLSLDDIQETSQASVDMKRDQQPSAVNVIPLTPICLVPAEEMEKKENPLLSRKGELLASRKDFRMNTCTPHSTGAFLLELAGLSPTHLQQQHLGSPRRATGTWGSSGACLEGATPLSLSPVTSRCVPAGAPGSGPGMEHPSASEAPVRALSFSEETGEGCLSPRLCAAGPDDDDIPGALGDDVEMTPALNEHVEAQRSKLQTRGYVLRERPPSPDPKTHSKEVLDPWQSLDPFGDSEEKPFRKGRPFLVPHGLDDVVGGKRKRKGPRKLQDFMRWFSATYNNITDSQKTRRKGPTFADLEVLYWRQLKKRLAAQKKLRGQGGQVLAPQIPPSGELGGAEGALRGSQGALRGLSIPADDDYMEHEDMEPEVPEELGDGALGELLTCPKFPTPSVPGVCGVGRAPAVPPCPPPSPLTRPPCPQEARAPFDVRGYGQSLVGGCGGLGQWRSFASLVAGQPPFEVCRYLLASLQLANDSVVELAQDAGLEAALDTARLRLLTLRPAHERFQAFQPPSLAD
ncbi:CNDH2 protein, partial [Formicarius rufipectus]|nr:CNDH2 protein [Formicarius rufipectus]